MNKYEIRISGTYFRNKNREKNDEELEKAITGILVAMLPEDTEELNLIQKKTAKGMQYLFETDVFNEEAEEKIRTLFRRSNSKKIKAVLINCP